MNKTTILIDRNTRRIGDFYAACLLLKRFPQISRITLGSLSDREDRDIVIGLGGRFEPSDCTMAFDTPRTHRNCASNPLGLILTYLGYYDTASYVWPWLYPLELREAHGPSALVEHLNCGHEVPAKLASPMEAAMLERFLNHASIMEADVLFHEMLSFGEFLIGQLIAAEAIDQWVDSMHAMIQVGDIHVLWIPSIPPAPIEQAVNRLMLRSHPEAACSVIPDQKGTGWTFFRFAFHHAKLDFTRVQRNEVCFCNQNGSLLKTRDRFNSAEDKDLIANIIQQATI